MINRSGYKIIAMNGIIVICLLALIHFHDSVLLEIFTLIACILFIFHFYFFRDPERNIQSYKDYIFSPADGKVINIAEVEENHYLHSKAIMVSIFMSIFDVYVNRVPFSGEIEYCNHKSGKYNPAYKDNSSEMNEHTVVGILTPQGKILVKQIAGIIARRIICNLKKGDKVKTGERFGMIKYGSRVDLFLPVTSSIYVALNERVRAGETIIGELTENEQ